MTNTGIVTRRIKGFYYLNTDNHQEIECKVKGQLFKDSRFDNQIAVGDRVSFIKNEADDLGLITGIKERKSFLSRNRVGIHAEQIIAANVDYLLIVAAAKTPPFRTNLVNRFLVAASVGNIQPILVLNKIDLATPQQIEELLAPYQQLDLKIILTSAISGQPNPQLTQLLSDKISVVAGQSGAGKSSLLNRHFPRLEIKVGALSQKTSKGSHTTTYAAMHRITESGYVIDTPGIREFGLWGVGRENLAQYYPLIADLTMECKHRDCHHIHEPQCAIKAAVESGTIHPSLYQGYLSIYDSISD